MSVSRHNCDPAVPVVERAALDRRDLLVVRVPDGQDKSYRASMLCRAILLAT